MITGTYNNQPYFEKYGIDITDPQYRQLGESKLPVETIEQIKEDIVSDMLESVRAKVAEINLSEEQIYALVDCAYQNGIAGARLDTFIQLYKQYGNTDQLRDAYAHFGYTSRNNARWRLFHEGIYVDGSNNEIDMSKYVSDTSKEKDKDNKDANSNNNKNEDKNTVANNQTTIETVNSDEEASFNDFLFIGDSRYYGITRELKELGTNVAVCAVSGSTPEQWLDTTATGSGTVLGTQITLPTNVSGVSVMLGVNATTQVNELEQVFQNLHSKYPKATIYYSCAYHISENYKVIDKSVMNANIDSFNESIKAYCGNNTWVKYVDISQELYDSNGFLLNADKEGIHLQGDGRLQLVDNIVAGIKGAGISTSSSQDDKASNNGNSTYKMVVANKTITTISKVNTYEYTGSNLVSTSSGTTGTSDEKLSQTPGAQTIESSSKTTYSKATVDYQLGLKDYTLYFDFLWALLINTSNKNFVLSLANLGINTDITVTGYNDQKISTNTSVQNVGSTVSISYDESSKTAHQDYYSITQTTTTTTTTNTTKPCVTYADVWLLKYENEADSYTEFKSKSKEKVTEKTTDDDDIMKLLRKDKKSLLSQKVEEYMLERMIKDNPKVSQLFDIYCYMLDKALEQDTDSASLLALVNIDNFDLTNIKENSANTVLVYDSINISDTDKENLYKAVEKMSEGFTDESKSFSRKQYITSVILNRTLSSKFPNNVTKVLKQKYQFEKFDPQMLEEEITISDETKTAVDNIIDSGDCAQYSVYLATPSQSKASNFDSLYKLTFNDGDKTDNSYNYYTTNDIIEDLKKYEIKVSGDVSKASSTANAIVAWAEAQVGKSSYYNRHNGGMVNSTNSCPQLVASAYYEAGLEYWGGNACDMPHDNEFKYNSDGTIDWTDIPVGACIVSKGTPVNGVLYGHVALYVGNGYVIEAGGSTVVKQPINESYGKGQFIGWGFAMSDQAEARSKLVVTIGGKNYGEGWTCFYGEKDISSTGIAGIYKNGSNTYKVYIQGNNKLWGNMPYSLGTYESSACGATSCAIIATGCGKDMTPNQMGESIYAGLGIPNGKCTNMVTTYFALETALKNNGIQNHGVYSATKEQIITQLQSGKPVIICIHGANIGNEYYGGHYVTLLGMNAQGEVMLGDPARGGRNSGYYTQDKIFTTATYSALFIDSW